MKKLGEVAATVADDSEAPALEVPLPFPRSSLADPPISPDEARGAETANCPRHGGIIGQVPRANDTEGRVYLCGVGGEYWRYSKQGWGGLKLSPLKYPKVGI